MPSIPRTCTLAAVSGSTPVATTLYPLSWPSAPRLRRETLISFSVMSVSLLSTACSALAVAPGSSIWYGVAITRATSRLVASSLSSALTMLPRVGAATGVVPPACSSAKALYLASSLFFLRMRRPPRRSTVTANTAATIHSLLWPTVVLASGAIDDSRRALVAPLARLWPRSGMTLPPEDLDPLFLVRGGVFLPRRILALRGPGRSTLPRSSPFLWCPIVLPILRSCSIDFQGSALRLVHTKLLRREGPDPLRARQFGDFDLESLPYFSGPIKPHAEFGGSGVEPRGERVQIDAPQHQQHGHHDQHRKTATPARGLPPHCAILRAVLGALLCEPRRFGRERSLVPALGGSHQLASTGGSAVLIAARSLADALRGFSSTSRPEGVRTAPRRKTGFAPQTHTGSSGGQTHRPSRPEMNRFTRRSSPSGT